MRAKPRPAELNPFKQYARSKALKAAERRFIKSRQKGRDSDWMAGLSAVIAWNYGPRTAEEKLFFGESAHDRIRRAGEAAFPFLNRIKKEPSHGKEAFRIPVVFR